MQLNPDCIRDILLTVERHATFDDDVEPEAFVTDGLPQRYGEQQLLYHIRQASEAGLLDRVEFFASGFAIRDLTPKGHEFLANVRLDKNWRKTKEVAAKIGSTSLKALMTVAANVISTLIEKTMYPN
ncbi:MAG: DUF2513 domain-containing protein [Lactobacillus sp.]|jgi:hypothetical protein|nr:DUF2513 domain-containing protein [Lactobacillus sp.]MCI2037200.1 DUF2513 domain-containing protein [Lactobacillus sp.]